MTIHCILSFTIATPSTSVKPSQSVSTTGNFLVEPSSLEVPDMSSATTAEAPYPVSVVAIVSIATKVALGEVQLTPAHTSNVHSFGNNYNRTFCNFTDIWCQVPNQGRDTWSQSSHANCFKTYRQSDLLGFQATVNRHAYTISISMSPIQQREHNACNIAMYMHIWSRLFDNGALINKSFTCR